MLALSRDSPVGLGEQIAEYFREQVRSGQLAPGHLLPPVRTLAKSVGVAPMTVVRAYTQLRLEGVVESRTGSGTRVARRPSASTATPLLAGISRRGPLNLYEPLSEAAGTVSLATSVPDPCFPVLEEILPGAFDALRESPWNAYYAPPRGTAEYANAVAELLRADGVIASPEQVVATFGSTHGRSLAMRALTHPGDAVAIESPSRLDAFAWAAAHGLRPIGVPRDRGRLDLERLAYAFESEQARVVYTMPTFGSTTGDVVPDRDREELLALAARHGACIVEDVSYSRLGFSGSVPAPLAARDPTRVVTIDSFSYCAAPGLRLGYVRAQGEWVAAIADESQRMAQSGIAWLQTAFAKWLANDGLTRHLRRVLPQYRSRRDAMIAALRRGMPPGTRWTDVEGGFSVWVTLPDGNLGGLYEAALAAGAPFAPGALFVPEGGERHLRLSYGRHSPEVLAAAVGRLCGLIRARIR